MRKRSSKTVDCYHEAERALEMRKNLERKTIDHQLRGKVVSLDRETIEESDTWRYVR